MAAPFDLQTSKLMLSKIPILLEFCTRATFVQESLEMEKDTSREKQKVYCHRESQIVI